MKSCSLILLLYFFFQTNAQKEESFVAPKFQKLDLKDGLSNLNVSSIVQDDLGYIWIGTARGINRFDGISFKHYTFDENKSTLYHDWITKLYKNHDGKIFCATRYGLNLFDPTISHMSRISSSKDFYIDFIDSEQRTYASSNHNGLSVFDDNDQCFKKIDHVSCNRILNNLVSDSTTGIWAKTIEKLTPMTPLNSKPSSQKQNHILINYQPNTNKYKEYIIPCNDLYTGPMVRIDSLLCILGKNLITFNLNTLTFGTIPKRWNKLNNIKEMNAVFIERVKRVDEDHLWIGSKSNGLYIFDLKQNKLHNLNESNSEFDAKWPTCICKDRDNNLWLGSFNHGLRVSFQNRANFNFDNSLNNLTEKKFITSITSDSKGKFYIGTRFAGLYTYNALTKRYKNSNKENSYLTSNQIRAVFIDSQDKLWVSSPNILNIKWPDKKKILEFKSPTCNYGMVSFCEVNGKIIASSDTQGFFIFSLEGTLLRQEKKLGKHISQTIPLNNEEILVSAYDNGIFEYNIESGDYRYLYKASKSRDCNLNQPITIYLDSDSVLWIGNYISGLHKIDLETKKISIYTTKDGLPSNDVVGIVEDNAGWLWLSTSYGLSHFDKKEEFANYFYNEGLNNIQFHSKSVHKDSEGIIYFGGSMGLNYFEPEKIAFIEDKEPPKIILESLRVQNKDVIPGDETEILTKTLNSTTSIILNHEQNELSFAYHAFDYIAADEIRYSYKLEGLEDQWSRAEKRNNANFSNLAPGKYVFMVKARNNNCNWSTVASVKIEIKPSPFHTSFAFIVYLFLFFTIAYTTFRLTVRAKLYRSKLDMEQNERIREHDIAEMKMRFFTNISHEIRTPLTLIKGNVDLLSQELSDQNLQLSSIDGLRYSTNRLLGLVNQLLSVRKLENDVLDLKIEMTDIIQLTQRLIQPFLYVASSRNITINVETELDKLIIPIDEDKYEKILSNLISNSLKHVKEKGIIKIRIEIADTLETSRYSHKKDMLIDNSFVQISVIDDGVGISKKDLISIFKRFSQSDNDRKKPDYSGTGIGLNFTKRLIALHHGDITAQSKPNVETIVSFILPLHDKSYSEDLWINMESQDKVEDIPSTVSVLPLDVEKEKPTLLLVEDDLELNRFISNILKSQYHIISCYNGKEALIQIQKQLPDIILSDIMMPKMDGHELCKYLREDEFSSHLPIILLTAKSDNESQITGYEYGADDYIVKPFEPKVLIARIDNLLTSRKKLKSLYKQGMVDSEAIHITNKCELDFVKKIQGIVDAEFHSPKLNVNYLANKMNMGRTNFYEKFVHIMDISPKGFITKYRINKSIEMMENGNDNFGEISFLCGFGSQSNYSAVFKKEKQISPSQFKKTLS